MQFLKKGSFTVEAAFIMPIILVILFGVIRGGFLLHDEAVLEAVVLEVLEKGEMAVKHIGDMETGRPDYEQILAENKELERKEVQEKLLLEELEQLFLIKQPALLSLKLSGFLLEEKKLELCGTMGERGVSLFCPTEYKRRVSR